MTRKAMLFLVAIFVFALGWNCRKPRPEPEFRPRFFIAKDIEARNTIYTSGYSEISSVSPKETYVLATQLTGDIIVAQKQQKPGLFFFTSAFATSPAPRVLMIHSSL